MRRFIIDTDTASDDAAAIMIAAMSPQIDLLGVTIVAGNVGLAQAIPEISSFNAEVITKIDEQVFTENFMNLFTPASRA